MMVLIKSKFTACLITLSLLFTSALIFTSIPVAKAATAQLEAIGFASGDYELSPSFDENVKHYTVEVDNIAALPEVNAVLKDGIGTVKIAQAQKTNGYTAFIGVKNEETDTSYADMYAISFATSGKVLPIECISYSKSLTTGTNSDANVSCDADPTTGTRSASGKPQVWDLGNTYAINEIRNLINFNSQQRDANIAGWQFSIDNVNWFPEDGISFSEGSGYSGNLFTNIGSEAYLETRFYSSDDPIFARYIRKIADDNNLAVKELIVIGEEIISTDLSSLSLSDNTALDPIFSADTTHYEVELENLENIPLIYAEAVDASTQVSVTQANEANGYVGKVIVQDPVYPSNCKEYTVHFSIICAATTLESIKISSGELAPLFGQNIYKYIAEIDSFRKMPVVEAEKTDDYANLIIVQPSAENGYCSTITLTDPAGIEETRVYTIQFSPQLAPFELKARADLSFVAWNNGKSQHENGVDGNLDTKTIGQVTTGEKYTVDMGSVKMVSQVKIYQDGTRRTDVCEKRYGRLEYSIDGVNFYLLSDKYTQVGDLPYHDKGTVYCGIIHDIPQAVAARFVRIQNTSVESDDDAAKQLSILEMEVLGYELTDYMISDEPLSAVTRNINPLRNSTIELGGTVYDLTWDGGADYIDLTTGEISKGNEDRSEKLSAKMISQNDPDFVLNQEFNITILGNTFPNEVKAYSEDFSVLRDDSAQGSVSLSGGALLLNGVTSYKAPISSVPEGFSLDIDTMIEFEVEKSETQEGKIGIMSGSLELLGIDFNAEGFKFNYGNSQISSWSTKKNSIKFKVELMEKTFNLYTDTGDGYYVLLYKHELKQVQRGFVDSVIFTTSANGDVRLKSLDVSFQRDKIFDALTPQICMEKITDEKSLNITKNLTLVKDVFKDFLISWSSSDEATINPTTGVVTMPQKPSYVTLRADLSYGEKNSFKEFTFLLGMDNLFSEKSVTASCSVVGRNYSQNIVDEAAETAFITSRTDGYYIDVNLGGEVLVSHFDILPAATEGSISEYKISASTDGKVFTEVYHGTNLIGYTNAAITPSKAKYIRFEVISTTAQGYTGLSELIGYYSPNIAQKLAADMEEVAIAQILEDGSTLPLMGTNGTDFSYKADNENVGFTAENGKIKVLTSDVDYDTTVVVEITGVLEGETQSKTFYTTVHGSKKVHDNKPSGGGSSGGGGGGVVSYISPVSKPDGGITTTNPQQGNIWSEIAAHWAKEELTYLYKNGIARGNGETIRLGDKITRSEFIALLIRAEKIEEVSYSGSFTDIAGSEWFAGSMQTAADLGIIHGADGKARPIDNITREETATIIANYIGELLPNEETKFTDIEDASSWSVDNIRKLSAVNLLNGYEDGSFKPKNTLNRGEAMVIIYRLMKLDRNNLR